MSYGTYDSYKDSGVDWLGEIPSDWDVEESKWLFSCRKEKANKNDEQLTASQKYGVIPQQVFMDLEERRVTVVYLNPEILKHVEKGDFVISMRSFQGGIEYCDYTGSVSSAYVPLIPNNLIFSPFFKYLFKSSRYIEALQSTSNLVRDGQALRYDNFCMIPLPVVPNETQIKIANFLDQKTAQIDQAIALKQQQIEKLGEYKQIVIQNAVTKGLDPNAPMKNSGVDWIGDIPEHWEVKKLKYLIDSKAGYAFPSQQFSQEGISVIRISELNINGSVDISNSPKLPFSFAKFLEEFCVVSGDILMAMTGGTIGKVSIYRENKKSLLNQRVCKFIVKASLDKKLFWHFCNSLYWKNYIDFKANGGAQPNISDNEIKKMYFPLPSISEQKTIANFLDEKTQNINQTIERYQTQIDRLKEYKNILINQAVTGKIKI